MEIVEMGSSGAGTLPRAALSEFISHPTSLMVFEIHVLTQGDEP